MCTFLPLNNNTWYFYAAAVGCRLNYDNRCSAVLIMKSAVWTPNLKLWHHLGESLLMNKYFAKKYVDAVEQNALSRRVSGGGTERSQRRVDDSLTWLRLGASSSGGSGRWRRLWGLGPSGPLVNTVVPHRPILLSLFSPLWENGFWGPPRKNMNRETRSTIVVAMTALHYDGPWLWRPFVMTALRCGGPSLWWTQTGQNCIGIRSSAAISTVVTVVSYGRS